MGNNIDNIADELSQAIDLNKKYLFGLYLFHETSPSAVKFIQQRAFKRTTKRVSHVIDKANELLAKANRGTDISKALSKLQWPGWTSDMEHRIRIMLDFYAQLFESRPMTPLMDGELAVFKKYVKDNL